LLFLKSLFGNNQKIVEMDYSPTIGQLICVMIFHQKTIVVELLYSFTMAENIMNGKEFLVLMKNRQVNKRKNTLVIL
jgi:hypothetical protein